MTVIHKRPDDWRVTPNFTEYEGTRARFAWQDAPDVCEGMDGGGCNIAFAALDPLPGRQVGFLPQDDVCLR